jgi:hypothetical protein
MTGSFPDGLVGVPYLQFLCLSIGQLKGPVPSAVGDMKHMMNVELGENFFQGTIPESWYDLRVLQKITLARNLITGTISSQVGRWKEMKAFYLNENDITGSIPAELFDMKSITFTWLDGNNIGGTIPTQIGNWKRAHEISFHRNQLTGPIPSTIGGLSSVMLFLRLHANMLNSSIPAEIQLMDNLRTLELTDNQLTGSLLPLTNMTKLETLLIENNKFSGLLPRELAQLKRLGLFYASGNDLDGPVPQRVCNLLAVDDAQGSTKSLKEFQLDCAVQLDGTVEIDCPCCTHCCDPDGTNCKEVVKT